MILLQSPRIFQQFKAIITREFEVLNINKYLCQQLVSSVKNAVKNILDLVGGVFNKVSS